MKDTELNQNIDVKNDAVEDITEEIKDNSENLGVKEYNVNNALKKNYYLIFYGLVFIYSLYFQFVPREVEFVLDGVTSAGLGLLIFNIIGIISANWLIVFSLLGFVLSIFKKYFNDFVLWYTVFVVMLVISSIISLNM